MAALEFVEWPRLHYQPIWLQLQVLDFFRARFYLRVLYTLMVILLSLLCLKGGQSILR